MNFETFFVLMDNNILFLITFPNIFLIKFAMKKLLLGHKFIVCLKIKLVVIENIILCHFLVYNLLFNSL